MKSCIRKPIRSSPQDRRGTVAVEFAFVAPLFVIVVMGIAQTTRMIESKTLLATAAREGARMAAMDREGLISDGISTNEKIEQDIANYLKASGVDVDDLDIDIVSHADPTEDFDLDDPANNYELFELHLSLPYSDFSVGPDDFKLTTKVVFRNAKSSLSE